MSNNTLAPLTWRAEKISVNTLKVWVKNPRKITKEALEKLKQRIISRGFHDVIKVDTDYTILSGNQRKKALIELGITEVIALIPDRPLTEEERNKVALESNTNDGDWDFDLLKDFNLDELLDIGFDADELNSAWADHLDVEDDEFNEGEEIKEITTPITKLGDLIELGTHRLLCGDSTNPEVLRKLLGNEKVSAIYSDPIYNLHGGVSYEKGVGGKANYGGEVNDSRTDEEYRTLIKRSMETALSVAKDDVHVFYWCDQSYIWLIQTLYRELGIENKRVCIWVKNGHNPTPGVAFNKCYEPCVYGVRGKPYVSKAFQAFNELMNDDIGNGNALISDTLDHIDVWAVKRLPGNEYEHATSKPPKLHEKAIRRCTKPGDIILDSFGGSGSTLIAAEQLKRRAFLVELEPTFCDLIIRRFEKLTGIKAKVIADEKGSSTN
jgi:DNA modification methylase